MYTSNGWYISDAELKLGPNDKALEALRHFGPTECRVVILGQDPYPTSGKGNGLAFGIDRAWDGPRLSKSIGNIAREVFPLAPVESAPLNDWATLEGWAEQGVLLLNTCWVLPKGNPAQSASQVKDEWVETTKALLVNLLKANPRIVFVAWGSQALSLMSDTLSTVPDISTNTPLLKFSHPSSRSAGKVSSWVPAFRGSNCFTLINKVLASIDREPVDWTRVSTQRRLTHE